MGSLETKTDVVQVVFMGLFLFSCGPCWCWTTNDTTDVLSCVVPCVYGAHLGCEESVNMWGKFSNNHSSSESIKGPAAKRKAALEGHIILQSPAEKQYLCIARWTALVWRLSTSVLGIQKENVSPSSGQSQVKERKMHRWKCNWKESVVRYSGRQKVKCEPN